MSNGCYLADVAYKQLDRAYTFTSHTAGKPGICDWI